MIEVSTPLRERCHNIRRRPSNGRFPEIVDSYVKESSFPTELYLIQQILAAAAGPLHNTARHCGVASVI